MNTLIKGMLSALILVAVSELSKRSTLVGGLLAALPLTSLLAFIWLYRDTHDVAAISALSRSIGWLVLPALVLFWTLPWFLRHLAFGWALTAATATMLAAYGVMLGVARWLGVQL